MNASLLTALLSNRAGPEQVAEQLATTAVTRPPPAARVRTSPPTFTRCQLRAASWVTHSPGPNAQPLTGSANRTALTAVATLSVSVAGGTSPVRGAGTPTQWAPESVVRTTEVHGGETQEGVVPSTYPVVGDTNVTEAGWNPAGTGPPAGSEGAAEDFGEAEAGPVGVPAADLPAGDVVGG